MIEFLVGVLSSYGLTQTMTAPWCVLR